MKVIGSPQQEAIWEALKQRGAPHLVIDAKAGVGKTFCLVHGAAMLPPQIQIAILCFNKPIAQELNVRLKQAGAGRNVQGRTFNSFGNQALLEHFGRERSLEEDKLGRLIGDALPESDIKYLAGPIEKVVRLLKCHMLDGKPDDVDTLVDRYVFEWANSTVEAVKNYAPKILRLCLEGSTFDFDDQVWLTLKLDLPVPTLHLVMVDEAQDTNEMQKQLVMKAAQSTGRIVVCGDSRQCQPPDTIIAVTGRDPVPICDVRVGDQVVSYNSQKTSFQGTVTQGRKVLEVSHREYSGDLIRVITRESKYSSRYTPEHRCLVRLTDLEKYAVYAMRRGSRVRVGVCRLMYPGNSGIAMRARQEKADAAWILSVEDNQEQALLQEERISAMFGLSQTIFENSQQHSPSQEFIDRLYSWLEDNDRMIDKLLRCLNHFGRVLDYPVWSRDGSNSHVGRKSFVTQACNLVEGMLVKVFDGDSRDSRWEHIEVSTENYEGHVYSLKVEPAENGRRLYVADGIVTHNSIYGFRGAGTKSIEEMKATLEAASRGCEVYPLTVSRRCGKSHIRMVQGIVPEIEAMEDAPEGVIESVPEVQAIARMRPNDLVLCRTNAPLIHVCYALIRDGIKAVIRGRKIGDGLLTLLKKLRPTDVADLMEKIGDYEDREMRKLEALGRKGLNRIQALQDKCECMIAMCEGMETLPDIENRIGTVFADYEPDGKPKKYVLLGTVHKCKGLEANNVFVLAPDLIPHPMAKQKWEHEQEANLAYIAMTRAKYEWEAYENVAVADRVLKHPGRIIFCGAIPTIYNPPEPAEGLTPEAVRAREAAALDSKSLSTPLARELDRQGAKQSDNVLVNEDEEDEEGVDNHPWFVRKPDDDEAPPW